MLKKIAVTCLALSTALCVSACQREEGPAEKAGKKIDDTVQEVKSSIQDNDTYKDLEKKVDEVADKLDKQGPAEKAGEKIDDAINQSN